MRSTLTAITVAALVLANSPETSGQSIVPDPTDLGREPSAAGLVAVVRRDKEDKGRVPLGARVVRSVVVRNVSAHTLRLAVASKSCGCVNAAADPSEIAPNAASTLTFEAPAAGVPEQQRVTVVFRAAAIDAEGVSQEIVAHLRYTTEFDYVVKPKRLHVVVTQRLTGEALLFLHTATVDNLRPQDNEGPWEDSGIVCDAPPVSEDGHTVWPIRFRVRSGVIGLQRGVATFQILGAKPKSVEVPLSVRVIPRWRVQPAGIVVDLRHVAHAEALRLELADNAPDAAPCVPRAVRLVPGLAGVSVELASDAPAGPSVNLRIDPISAQGPVTAELQLLNEASEVVGIAPVVLYRPTDAPVVPQDGKVSP